jgi:hypothetical protein
LETFEQAPGTLKLANFGLKTISRKIKTIMELLVAETSDEY